MKHTVSVLFVVIYFFAVPFLSAHTASIFIKGENSNSEIEIELQKQEASNVYRAIIKKEEIPQGTKYIEVKLDVARAKKGSQGYFVLGDGRLGTFRLDNNTLEERRNPLPIFGMKTERDSFVAIVKKMKYEFSTIVKATKGEYIIYPRFYVSYDKLGCAPYEDIVVDFYFLPKEDCDYSAMGRIYRKYQLDRNEVIPLKERVKNNPELAYTVDSIFIRVKHGVKHNKKRIADQTPENEPPVSVSITFDKFKEIMRQLKESGVEKAEICSVGFNSGGFDGRFPDIFPVESAFGGEEKLKEAINYAHSIGYQIVSHVCNTDFYSIAKRFDKNDIALRPDGTLHHHAILAGGKAYFPCFKQVFEKYIKDDYKQLSKLGFKGTHHIDVTSNITPYPCSNPKHPCTRKETAKYMNNIGFAARKTFGGFGSEGPCDHVAKTLDFALYTSAYPRFIGKEHPLVDTIVPLWQIVYHGIILSNPFYWTIDYNINEKLSFSPSEFMSNTPIRKQKLIEFGGFDPQMKKLRLIEFGGRPVYYFIDYTPTQIVKIKEAYDEYQKLKHLQYEFIERHKEIAPKVFLTRYSDNSEIICNYSDEIFKYSSAEIAPKAYKLFYGSEK